MMMNVMLLKSMRLFLLILFVQFAILSKSQTNVVEFQDNANTICMSIVSLRMAEADTLLNLSKKQYPENLMLHIQSFFRLFVTAFITEDLKDHVHLQEQKRILLKLLNALPGDNPHKRWAMARIYLQSAFVRLKFNEQYAAAWEIRKAYFLIEENRSLFPDFVHNHLVYGLLQIMIGSIPPQYQWVVQLIAMDGDVDNGREVLYDLLNKVENTPDLTCLRAETLFFLSFTEMNLQADKAKLHHLLNYFRPADQLCLLLVYAKANLEMRTGMNDAAFLTLSRRPIDDAYIKFHYLDFLLAETLLRKLDASAEVYYENFIQNFEGHNYKRDAARKLAWLDLLLEDNSVGYLRKIQRIYNLPVGMVESDIQATKEAGGMLPPNKQLLKARLLFDGGYLIRAKSLLLSYMTQINDQDDAGKLTFYYQLARVEHELENYDLALSYYNKTILLGAKKPEYYAAAAALRSGEIHELNGDFDQAVLFYNKCLSLKPEEYRQGLHLKAKAALSRLQK